MRRVLFFVHLPTLASLSPTTTFTNPSLFPSPLPLFLPLPPLFLPTELQSNRSSVPGRTHLASTSRSRSRSSSEGLDLEGG
ncbi:hypothetical protein BDY24DRAFT_404544 [Mrakia frigida]|uniref:uncharacterized protein n=1 Tax=Mrakia frigida TaxID=29902 RepID=UPI003FCBEF64